MKILAAQINPTVGDFEGNFEKIKAALTKGDFVVTPELALCGYPPDDFLLHADFMAEMKQRLMALVPLTLSKVLIVGLARQEGRRLYNSAAVIENGVLVGFADKRLLPNYDVFYEKRYFCPGEATAIWTLQGKRVAITICEDIWEEAPVLLELERERFDLLVNLSASPFYMGRPEHRLKLCSEVSRRIKAPLLYCNQVGGNDSLIFDGHSLFVSGERREMAAGFREEYFICDLERGGGGGGFRL